MHMVDESCDSLPNFFKKICSWKVRACHPAVWPIIVLVCIGVFLHFLQNPSEIIRQTKIEWESIPQYRSSTELVRGLNASRSDYWIVATTINPPQKAIRQLTALRGWQVVVVGDTKTPHNWSLPGVIFLGLEDQRKLGYRIHNLLPYRSYARKNIGYLFAIQHGAKVIYETDDDNILLVKNLRQGFDVELSDAAKGRLLMFEPREDRNVVNPYIHFGQPSMWPRGFPLDAIAQNKPEAAYVLADQGVRPLVQQGLANGDPDVDAIFRLTRVSSGKPIRVRFDSEALPIAIPPGSMCPFNTQNTLFHRDAFWGLLIPITTSFRVCDIWRGFWVQRLLADIGGVLAFYPPSVYQDRNVHDYFEDFLLEKDLYMDSRALVDYLLEWKSDAPHLFDRALSIITAMAARGFWHYQDMDLAAAWFADLIAVGYQPPKLLKKAPRKVPGNFSKVNSHGRPLSPHNPLEENATILKPEAEASDNPKSLPSTFLDTVPSGFHLKALENLQTMRAYFRNIVLILNFDHANDISKSVGFWRTVYERLFDHVVVVSERANEKMGVQEYPYKGGRHPHELPGFYAYSVVPRIMAQHPQAEGFLWTNDDLILNYWTLLGADKNKIWFLSTKSKEWSVEPLEGFRITQSIWWRQEYHYNRTVRALDQLKPEYLSQYKESLVQAKLSDKMAQVKTVSDTYYLPRRHVAAATEIINTFLEADLVSEMAIPSMFCALESPTSFDPHALQEVVYLRTSARNSPERKYNIRISALHPWKLTTPEQQERALLAMAEGDPSLGQNVGTYL